DRSESSVDPEIVEGMPMDCPACRGLKRAYEAAVSEYMETRSSACFRVCLDLAARKNVEMERARYELEEHRRGCVFAAISLTLLPVCRSTDRNGVDPFWKPRFRQGEG